MRRDQHPLFELEFKSGRLVRLIAGPSLAMLIVSVLAILLAAQPETSAAALRVCTAALALLKNRW